MKILFVCSSQEEGKDGVGDYARRLAAELIIKGHETIIIGLFDRFTDTQFTGIQIVDKINVSVVRLPAKNRLRNNLGLAKTIIDNFRPDWISLHFVPYSYSVRGLSFRLGLKLKSLCPLCKWQIMVHELWIGRELGSGMKRLAIGMLQKMLVKSMIDNISPKVIHTHLPVFYDKLKLLGFQAEPLPLFSNIEKVDSEIVKKQSVFCIGFFSQAAATPAIVKFLEQFSQALFNANMQLELIFIGGNKDKMKLIGNSFEHINNLKHIKYTGFLRGDEVSLAMQSCDMGITPFPRHALGKSSSLSVFFAHGLPVAAPNVHFLYNENEIGFFSEQLKKAIVIEPTLNSVAIARKAAENTQANFDVSFITNVFIADLKKAGQDY